MTSYTLLGNNLQKIILYFIFGLAFVAMINSYLEIQNFNQVILQSEQKTNMRQAEYYKYSQKYHGLKKKIADCVEDNIDISSISTKLDDLKKDLVAMNFSHIDKHFLQINGDLDVLYAQKKAELKLAEENRIRAENVLKTGLMGLVVGEDKPQADASVSFFSGDKLISNIKTGADGRYLINLVEGKYKITCSKAGYISSSKNDQQVTNLTITPVDITLQKYIPPPPKPKPVVKPPVSVNSSTAHSTYTRGSVISSAGTYSIDLIKLDLSSGHIKVVTDTANNSDCTNNCLAKSLASYISQNKGFAGINGTYFCPPDYSSCAGQTNSYFWKVYNTRLGKMINGESGLAVNDPFLIFDSNGKATYLSYWKDYTAHSFIAGINCKPRLIENGKNVLNVSSLDSKQKNTKSNRGALALKGQILYAIVVKGATIPNLTAVLMALGVDNAINIDGGGSSALYYNGSYKVGPGRSLPNAVVFVER